MKYKQNKKYIFQKPQHDITIIELQNRGHYRTKGQIPQKLPARFAACLIPQNGYSTSIMRL